MRNRGAEMSEKLAAILQDAELPELLKVTRHFPQDGISDVADAVTNALDRSGVACALAPGGSVALGVGSRGIASLPEVVRATVGWFQGKGAKPFIVPCMGSHGGATAEGQKQLLGHLGITEEAMRCAVISGMDVTQVGTLPNGLPVYMDAGADAASAVFVINRVKAHTAFTGRHESGLLKMLTIGLGKRRGAESCHELGFGAFAEIMPEMGRCLLQQRPGILGGLALVENERDQLCHVEAVRRHELVERDAQLLVLAKRRMATLPFAQVDVLLIQRMGKNISGAGMDPNITGRSPSPFKSGGLQAGKMGVLRLTPQSRGNATGIGAADVTTRSLADALDAESTYINVLTSTVLRSAMLPVVMPDDRTAVQCLVKTCNACGRGIRLAYIQDTLSLGRFWASPALAAELRDREDCDVDAGMQPFVFDGQGCLCGPGF